MELLELVRGKKVMVGAVDVATNGIEIRGCRQGLPMHQLWYGTAFIEK